MKLPTSRPIEVPQSRPDKSVPKLRFPFIVFSCDEVLNRCPILNKNSAFSKKPSFCIFNIGFVDWNDWKYLLKLTFSSHFGKLAILIFLENNCFGRSCSPSGHFSLRYLLYIAQSVLYVYSVATTPPFSLLFSLNASQTPWLACSILQKLYFEIFDFVKFWTCWSITMVSVLEWAFATIPAIVVDLLAYPVLLFLEKAAPSLLYTAAKSRLVDVSAGKKIITKSV